MMILGRWWWVMSDDGDYYFKMISFFLWFWIYYSIIVIFLFYRVLGNPILICLRLRAHSLKFMIICWVFDCAILGLFYLLLGCGLSLVNALKQLLITSAKSKFFWQKHSRCWGPNGVNKKILPYDRRVINSSQTCVWTTVIIHEGTIDNWSVLVKVQVKKKKKLIVKMWNLPKQ